ncbi:MAG: lipid-A-disaccharide synthase-related protein [Microcystaceae cyanobacterium]
MNTPTDNMESSQVLFVSNGHGEDLNSSLIIKALQQNYPSIRIHALPLVGLGTAYQKLNIPIISPTKYLPSGGIIYTNLLNYLKDIFAGLIGLTIQQIQAVLKERDQYNLIVAVGDIVPIAFAYITRKPFIAFIVSTSSYYEGKLKLPWITALCLRSPRCQKIIAKDEFTVQDLKQRGFSQALCVGYPIMDDLEITGKNLELIDNLPMIALLPGSRVPEALNNLAMQLKVCEAVSKLKPMQFCAALVPSITETALNSLAKSLDWQYLGSGKFVKNNSVVNCYWDAFADILHHCQGAIAMAGTAVEQAVGLGKPVIQIPGNGPQFTYAFAEAQMRLLGSSVITVGSNAQTTELFQQTAEKLIQILDDPVFLDSCKVNGLERIGQAGGSLGIAQIINQELTLLNS